MVKSHQRLSKVFLEIIHFSTKVDRPYPLVIMGVPGILRFLSCRDDKRGMVG